MAAQTTCTPANSKSLTQVLTEFQPCATQGFPAGCIGPGQFQDLVCSAQKIVTGDWVTVAPSGATYTPDFSKGVNFSITLSASCPCTLANPINQQNQSGVFEVIQDAVGSRTIGTYGSTYLQSTIPALTSGIANAKDYVPYVVNSAGKIVFGPPQNNAN